MKTLHQIGSTVSQDILIAIWYYKSILGVDVGISGDTLVEKNSYYGDAGRWIPIRYMEDDMQYMREVWKYRGSPDFDINTIPRGIKLD